jgi:hypothetical protein
MWVRVKDTATGHEFDVQEGSILLRRGAVKPIARHKPSATPRRPKHHLNLAPVRAQDVAASAGDETTTTEQETHDE